MKEAPIGIALMILSTFMYGLANPLLKKAGVNPIATIFFEVLFLLIAVLPFLFFSKSYVGILEHKNALALLALVGVLNAIGFFLLVKSYKYLPIWQISLITAALVPMIAAIAAYFFLHEQLSAKFFVGLFITLAGLFIALI